MQFGLTNVFAKHELDTIYSLPFILTIPLLPAFFMSCKPGHKRRRVNQFLRKVVHIINIFVPTMVFMILYLLFMSFWTYYELLFKAFTIIPEKPGKNFAKMCLWVVAGPFLLTKLYCMDIATCCKILLKFRKE